MKKPLETVLKGIFFALLLAAGGNPVTAMDAWLYLGKSRGFSYSSQFFQAGHMGLISDLMRYDLVRILRISLKPVRSCGIRPEEISCDYYDMLDGKRSMGDVADFLPGYPWSAALFCSSRVEQQAQWGGCRPERRAVRVRSGRVQAESGL